MFHINGSNRNTYFDIYREIFLSTATTAMATITKFLYQWQQPQFLFQWLLL